MSKLLYYETVYIFANEKAEITLMKLCLDHRPELPERFKTQNYVMTKSRWKKISMEGFNDLNAGTMIGEYRSRKNKLSGNRNFEL